MRLALLFIEEIQIAYQTSIARRCKQSYQLNYRGLCQVAICELLIYIKDNRFRQSLPDARKLRDMAAYASIWK
jgi:hypothetical protein